MSRRFLASLGLMPALFVAPSASAAWWEPPAAGSDQAGLTGPGPDGDGVHLFSRRLGRGVWLSRNMHMVPYLEVASSPGPALTAEPSPYPAAGHFLVGALASYRLAQLWTVSFDLAAGRPLAADLLGDPPRFANVEQEDHDISWRTAMKLGYALGKNFSAFTSLELGDLSGGQAALLSPLPYVNPVEASVRLGLTYRFR